ncbi:MAG: alpha/beta fold hydrolase [Thermonemataceae bacterium]
MKTFAYQLVLLTIFSISYGFSQEHQPVDTLIEVRNHKIHFSLIKGEGTPILFESGAGNDGSVWKPILKEIHEITGATLITYDRAGFGKSTVDTLDTNLSNHNVIAGILDLEAGLKQLGYDEDIMLVSHSYGGYFSYLYASRHPNKVKAIVAIDIVHNYHEDGYAEELVKKMEDKISEWKDSRIGMYYLLSTLVESKNIIAKTKIPQNIPVFDIEMGADFGSTKKDAERWHNCHKNFIESNPNVEGMRAANTGHYVWRDNPSLVINVISKYYAKYTNSKNSIAIYDRASDYAIEASNSTRKNAYSESEINFWGYDMLKKDNTEKALKIFELNTLLYPESFNTYDSYGEALLKNGEKEKALEMYRKSVKLNPDNKSALEKIKQLTNE